MPPDDKKIKDMLVNVNRNKEGIETLISSRCLTVSLTKSLPEACRPMKTADRLASLMQAAMRRLLLLVVGVASEPPLSWQLAAASLKLLDSLTSR